MCQNAPNPISISIFPGVTPDPHHWGLCPQTPPGGEEGEGREGREGKGQVKGRGGKGEGRGSLRHCRWGIDAPVCP